jgi:regulator of protease activity HflC (stomatin/prohibitin superfamily)
MISPSLLTILLPILAVVFVLASAIRILREYQRGVVFTLGRFSGVKGPGLILVILVVQQMVRIDLRTRVFDVPPQDVILRDNVSVKVNAVVYYRVIDPEKRSFRSKTSIRPQANWLKRSCDPVSGSTS